MRLDGNNTGPAKLGKYEILWELGRGGMGVVYEGFDPLLERRVAIKTLHANFNQSHHALEILERFRREAQAAGRLSHPNIVTVYEFGNDNGTLFIAMEFIEGRDLKAALQENQPLSVPEVLDIMRQLLAGLEHAHRHGVVHRDIKPANIFLLNNGGLKLGDFGVARVEASDLTQTGSSLGTPTYMSPEQIMGYPIDQRSDLFAAGVVLYELLTGAKPFTGELTTITHKIVKEDPPWPSSIKQNLPRALDAIVRQALAKKPEERFQSAQEFNRVLQAVSAMHSLAAVTPVTSVTPITQHPSQDTYSPTLAAHQPSTTFVSGLRSMFSRPLLQKSETSPLTTVLPAAATRQPKPAKTIQIPVTQALFVFVIVLILLATFAYWMSSRFNQPTSPTIPIAVMPAPQLPQAKVSSPMPDSPQTSVAAVEKPKKTAASITPEISREIKNTNEQQPPLLKVNPYGQILAGEGIQVEMAWIKQKNEYDLYDALLKITGEAARKAGIEGKVIKYAAIPKGFPGDFDYRFQQDGVLQTRMEVRVTNNRTFYDVVFGAVKHTVYFDTQLTNDADPLGLLKEYLAARQ